MLKQLFWLADERVNTNIHVRNEHLKKTIVQSDNTTDNTYLSPLHIILYVI